MASSLYELNRGGYPGLTDTATWGLLFLFGIGAAIVLIRGWTRRG